MIKHAVKETELCLRSDRITTGLPLQGDCCTDMQEIDNKGEGVGKEGVPNASQQNELKSLHIQPYQRSLREVFVVL